MLDIAAKSLYTLIKSAFHFMEVCCQFPVQDVIERLKFICGKRHGSKLSLLCPCYCCIISIEAAERKCQYMQVFVSTKAMQMRSSFAQRRYGLAVFGRCAT